MVKTRRDKREAPQDEDAEADTALEQAKLIRAAKAKRRRMEAFARNHPPFEMFPTDILPHIFLFFDSTKDVHSLSRCSKYLRESLTPEIVVRSAVFGGGKMRDAVGSVVQAIKNKSIHVPSTLRLLRLVNAKRCERGDECFAYNLIKKKPDSVAKSGKRPFGLAICQTCVKCATNNVLQNRNHFLHGEKRVETVDHLRLLSQPHREFRTDDVVGPLILAQHVKQIESTYYHDDERKQAFDLILGEIDEATPTEDTTRADDFVSAHEMAESQFDAFQKAKEDIIRNKQREKEAVRSVKRRESAEVIFSKVEDLLQDYIHKDFVLKCRWNEAAYCYFDCQPVDAILGALLRAPSAATQKKISTTVDSVIEVVDLLHSNGFMALNYLFFLRSRTGRHQRALYQYCLSERTFETVLGDFFANAKFVDYIRQGKPIDALVHVLAANDLDSVFCRHVVTARDQDQRTQLETLARSIWRWKVTSWTETNTEEKFRQKFDLCRTSFTNIKASIRDYLADPLTIEFLQLTGPPTHRPNQQFSRQNVVDTIYGDSQLCPHDLDRIMEALEGRNFEVLRVIHREMFRNPHFFGFDPSLANEEILGDDEVDI